MSACNDRDSSRDVTYSPPRIFGRAESPPRGINESFSIHSVQSSAKKLPHSSYKPSCAIPFNLDKAGYGGDADLLQSKVEHLEKERIELSLQLHMRDEKDRDRKFKLEQMEFKLKMCEEERTRMSADTAQLRDEVYKLQLDKEELQSEVLKLQRELANSNRHEASESWKKITATSRELQRVEEENEALRRELKELR
eukprot:gene46019-56327_t